MSEVPDELWMPHHAARGASRASRPRRERYACPCGYQRAVSVPWDVQLEAWLTDYPCPLCAAVHYPRRA